MVIRKATGKAKGVDTIPILREAMEEAEIDTGVMMLAGVIIQTKATEDTDHLRMDTGEYRIMEEGNLVVTMENT